MCYIVRNMAMPKVSAKRQITLPIEQCRLAGIEPGDEYNSYVDNDGHITVVKQMAGSAKGVLKGLKVDKRMSDEGSLSSSMNQ
jgi:bifunctional DNA-binding transcriptional regulator/antitoxin component of YhaV-PrlF toxin-antitoxin module